MTIRRLVSLGAPVLLLAAAGALLFVPGDRVLEIVSPRQGRVLWSSPIAGEFELAFTHSANRGGVVERYVVDQVGGIALREARFEAFGAGVPVENEGAQRVRLTDEGVVVTYGDRPVGEFRIFVGTVADHRIRVGKYTVALSDLSAPTSTVVVRVSRRSLFETFWRKTNG